MTNSAAQTIAKPRKRSKRGIEAEQKLLEAANTVFWTNGFAGCTIAQIIEESGLSVGSFYHQFSDKRELLDRAKQNVLADFRKSMGNFDLSRAGNETLFQLFHALTMSGRDLIASNRGFYRAISEIAQNQAEGFGDLRIIGATVIAGVGNVIDEYADQLVTPPSRETVAHAVQLMTMCVLQTELGMGPQFPTDVDEFANVIARAACGVLGYQGPTDIVPPATAQGAIQ